MVISLCFACSLFLVLSLKPNTISTRKSPTGSFRGGRCFMCERQSEGVVQQPTVVWFALPAVYSSVEQQWLHCISSLYWIMGRKVLELHKALLPVGHPDVGKILLVWSIQAQHHNVSISQYGKTWCCPCI
jgi:hypothetical protein